MSTSVPATNIPQSTARPKPVGAARSPAARPLANLVAWRLRFRQRGDHARGRGRGLAFLFKLRLTANVKRMIEKLACAREWVCAGQGFEELRQERQYRD